MPPSPVRTVVDGVAFDPVTEAEAVARVSARAAVGAGGFVLTPNASILRQLRSPDLGAVAADADLVLADGMPIVWASRVGGTPLPARVTGASLIWSLCAAAARDGRRVHLLGGEAGVAERGARVLTASYPGLEVSWHFPPFGFERDPAALAAVDRSIRDHAPGIVFVGLGFPKQERLIMSLRSEFPEVWFVACGAALTFVAGDISRAPRWMQDRGVEWVHRLAHEPGRLARRYLLEDVPFAVGLLGRALRGRARRARRAGVAA